MLASLLPGIRELRAPFAAGVLLVAAVHLAAYPVLLDATNERSLSPGLNALVDLAGSKGLLAVLSVIAYLLGTLYLSVLKGVLWRLRLRTMSRFSNPKYIDSRPTLNSQALAPFTRPSLRRLFQKCGGDERVVRGVCIDIIVGGGKRLMVSSKDLYVEYDRLHSEVDFRDAVALPSVAIAVLVVSNTQWSVGLSALTIAAVSLAAATLTYQARVIQRDAYSMYAHCVADGVVSTATMDAVSKTSPPAGA